MKVMLLLAGLLLIIAGLVFILSGVAVSVMSFSNMDVFARLGIGLACVLIGIAQVAQVIRGE